MDLDDILKPSDGSKPAKVNSDGVNPKTTKRVNDTKDKLADLKATLQSDPIFFDPANHDAFDADFPTTDNTVKFVDYINDRIPAHIEFATNAINSIISTYVKSDSLLNSPRLKGLKEIHILNYSKLLLMLENTEANLIKLQENIDGGDMSKEMFDNVRNYQIELRANLKEVNTHLDKCDSYWENYAEMYGFENQEDKIIQETEKPVETNQKQIIDMADLTNMIRNQMEEQKLKESEERKKED